MGGGEGKWRKGVRDHLLHPRGRQRIGQNYHGNRCAVVMLGCSATLVLMDYQGSELGVKTTAFSNFKLV